MLELSQSDYLIRFTIIISTLNMLISLLWIKNRCDIIVYQ